MAFDYGRKRTGIAVTDPLKIIANALDTVETDQLMEFVGKYLRQEAVECFVVGDPRNLDNSPSQISDLVSRFVGELTVKYPEIPVARVDERFTSKIAAQTILAAGKNKKARRDKSLVDKVSAVIILQSYLESIS